MKALAWDDKPEYMNRLADYLKKHYKIDLVVEPDEDRFSDRYLESSWDFVVVDLMEERKSAVGDQDRVGLRLARAIADHPNGRGLPIFMVTNFYDRLKLGELPPNVIPKSKSTQPGWMAGEIKQELVQRGVYVDHRKIFLIYGHDRNADGATSSVKSFLNNHGITVEKISGDSLHTEILNGLLQRMNECSAFVAICTPDDKSEEGTYHPRQNVLLEIGIAMGLSRGLQRLVPLQRWGPEKEDQAVLPSDLGGVVPIRFLSPKVENQFNALRSKLEDLGVKFGE
jgi:predicted nucleotide-binding protein